MKLKYSSLLSHPRFLLTAVITLLHYILYSFVYTSLELNLDRFKNGIDYVLPVFLITDSTYLLTLVVLNKCLSN